MALTKEPLDCADENSYCCSNALHRQSGSETFESSLCASALCRPRPAVTLHLHVLSAELNLDTQAHTQTPRTATPPGTARPPAAAAAPATGGTHAPGAFWKKVSSVCAPRPPSTAATAPREQTRRNAPRNSLRMMHAELGHSLFESRARAARASVFFAPPAPFWEFQGPFSV